MLTIFCSLLLQHQIGSILGGGILVWLLDLSLFGRFCSQQTKLPHRLPIFSNNSTLGDRKRISEEDGRPTLKIKRAPFEVLYSWQYTQLQVSIRALFIYY